VDAHLERLVKGQRLAVAEREGALQAVGLFLDRKEQVRSSAVASAYSQAMYVAVGSKSGEPGCKARA
jgi:hypothetical protein